MTTDTENIKPVVTDDEKTKRGDSSIWGIYIALILVSIVECFSASSQEISGSGLAMYTPIL